MDKYYKELDDIRYWMHDCLMRMVLNVNIDEAKVSKHPLYEFKDFRTAIHDPHINQTVIDYMKRYNILNQ